MTPDDLKKMYLANDSSEHKRKILFEMAAVYRELIFHENQRINYRTTWFLSFNGFLFGAYAIILAYYKGSHGFLISVSLVFAVLGSVMAIEIYKRGIDNAIKALRCIHNRWRNFLENVFGYPLPPNEIDENYCIPPVDGLYHRARMRVHLAYLMTGAWIALFIVIHIFNTVPCLRQSVSSNPSRPAACASQGSTATPLPATP